LGMGPGFVMIYFVTKANTLTVLKHAYVIRNRIHVFVLVGGTLLLITGLWMGFLNTELFKTCWYVVSLILYLIAMSLSALIPSPRSKAIKQLLKETECENIPPEYGPLANEQFFYERMTNVIFLIVNALMIVNPF